MVAGGVEQAHGAPALPVLAGLGILLAVPLDRHVPPPAARTQLVKGRRGGAKVPQLQMQFNVLQVLDRRTCNFKFTPAGAAVRKA